MLVSACFVSHFEVKAVAVATLIDLIHATKSVHGDTASPTKAKAGCLGVAATSSAFVVFPTLSKELLDYLNEKTYTYKVRVTLCSYGLINWAII